MPRPIDLPRIRRALARLDQIAAEHPDYCRHQGQWTENEVEKIIMGTPTTERVKAFRARLRADGWKQINVYLSPAAQARLNELQQQFPHHTVSDIINTALLRDYRAWVKNTGAADTTKDNTP